MPANPKGNVIIQRGKTEQVWHSLAEHTSAAKHVISSHSAAKTPPSILQPTLVHLDTELPCANRPLNVYASASRLLLHAFNPTLAFPGVSPAFKCQ